MLLGIVAAAALALPCPLATAAMPLAERQGLLRPSSQPFVGSPWGDWYRSTNVVQCEPLSISFGGGEGAPYSIAIVTPPADANASASDVEVLERVGVLGMPGYTYYSIDGSDLKVGTPVALQITDRAGQVAYSVNRHVAEGHLNEFCHYPGAFWPPSHWDGNHFVAMLAVVIAIAIGIWLGGERVKNFVVEQQQKRVARRRERLFGGIALAERGPGDRSRAGGETTAMAEATHVLGDDADRTSLEEEDEDRPLLDPETGLPPLPPAYEDAVKPEDGRTEGSAPVSGEGQTRRDPV